MCFNPKSTCNIHVVPTAKNRSRSIQMEPPELKFTSELCNDVHLNFLLIACLYPVMTEQGGAAIKSEKQSPPPPFRIYACRHKIRNYADITPA